MPAILSVDLIEIAVFAEFSPENRPELPPHLEHARRRERIVGQQEVMVRLGIGRNFRKALHSGTIAKLTMQILAVSTLG